MGQEDLCRMIESPSQQNQQKNFVCSMCGKSYLRRSLLVRHMRFECQKEPSFLCPFCPYKAFHNFHLKSHIAFKHKVQALTFAL